MASDDIKVKSVPEMSLDENIEQLKKFEDVFMEMSKETKEEFERMFSQKLYWEVNNVDYRAWVHFKAATLVQSFADHLWSHCEDDNDEETEEEEEEDGEDETEIPTAG